VRAVEEIVTAPRETAARAERQVSPTPPEAEALIQPVADRLDTRVRVSMGRRRGKLTIEFADLEDLGRIVGLLTPGEAEQDGGSSVTLSDSA